MTTVQRAAQVFGWIFIAVGVIGFLYSRGSTIADTATAPHIFGLFAVNIWHNLVHLGSGIAGVALAGRVDSAIAYCKTMGVIYLLLVPLGFIIPSTLGLMPIGGNDIWLHALLGIGLAYFGFTAHPRTVGTAGEAREHATAARR